MAYNSMTSTEPHLFLQVSGMKQRKSYPSPSEKCNPYYSLILFLYISALSSTVRTKL